MAMIQSLYKVNEPVYDGNHSKSMPQPPHHLLLELHRQGRQSAKITPSLQ